MNNLLARRLYVEKRKAEIMDSRRMIAVLLSLLGLLSLGIEFFLPLYIAIRERFPIISWINIALFAMPLVVVGVMLWYRPYRLWSSKKYYGYTITCAIISACWFWTLITV